jgi:protein SCO1
MIFESFSKIIKIITLSGLSVGLVLPAFLFAHVPDTPKSSTKNTTAVNVRVPDFVLMNQDNQRFDSTQLRGKVLVLNFIFTTCTDVCPLFTMNLAALQRNLNGRYADELFFISVTTDPEIDSAKHLKAYGQRHGADFKNWAFLTGSESQLKEVWNNFGVTVIKKSRGLVQHTSLTTVIDRQGFRRMNYLGEKWNIKDLERDVLTLLAKKA